MQLRKVRKEMLEEVNSDGFIKTCVIEEVSLQNVLPLVLSLSLFYTTQGPRLTFLYAVINNISISQTK